ncbi:site-2 protease family protein [Heyndrickxia acidiproducens]|jgi:Zn-dependent protease|uniref:site-2 protease family protein n=1 Tax=Heyndrickxia acidiproducens TaxID=1121084 RepID=UPI000364ACC8|nr:site-2 protease family protein [Heyndrickxia acidiproducens]
MSGKKGKTLRTAISLGSIGLLIAAKLKYLLVILKLTKLSSLFTLFLSLGVYAVAYGWSFAIALMYSMLVHESGHMIAAKQRGVKTSPIFFIPFVGAAVGLKEDIKHSKDESYIAYGGPLFGTIATIIALLFYLIFHGDIWLLAVYIGSILNLFNLIPLSPLDGGRIVTVLSPKIWGAGLLLLGVYTFFVPSPIVIFIIIIGAIEAFSQLRRPYEGRLAEAYVRMLKKRKKRFEAYQQMDDVYQRNTIAYDDVQYARHLKERFEQLEENQKLDKKYRKPRLALMEKQLEMYDETSYEDVETGLNWLGKTIKTEKEAVARRRNYYKTTTKEKISTGLAYLGLIAVLGVLFYISRDILPDPHSF